jgi:D-proline reductase (dithiol) PrdB
MSTDRQPPVKYIERITATYDALGYEQYQWHQRETRPPFFQPKKPLAECKVGMVATGGVYRTGQVAFHYKDDTSYRAIPSDTDVSDLRATHFAYDLSGAREDINVVFPIEGLRSLYQEGFVGSVADDLLTCMGGIYSQRAVTDELAPQLVQRCIDDKIDIVLLVPV